MSYKAHFRRFLDADPERLHFAAHSHHLWPDVTFEAQRRCWDDAARLADRKWDHVFGEVYPAVQRGVARLLNLPDPTTLAFGPNTHAFVMRLMSCLPPGRPARVLTTDGEFHSFARQIARLEEDTLAQVTRIAVEPFESFTERFAAALRADVYDLIYVSHVFYSSGCVVPDLPMLVDGGEHDETLIVIDGYHGFMALPSDLGTIADRVFYLAGGYKYAMAGEGVAFLHAPHGRASRPRDTGWYAAFGALERSENDGVGYAADASRFLGATFDPVGLYRLRAVLDWVDSLGIGAAEIHAHAHALQEHFIEGLGSLSSDTLNARQLVVPLRDARRGNFLAFQTPHAESIHHALLARHVVTDYRGDRLRIGFGLYHDADDVDRLCERLSEVL